MIDIRNSTIKRIIIHRVLKKGKKEDHSSVEVSDEMINATDEVKEVLCDRITEACAKDSRAFEAEIADCTHNSFFDFTHNLYDETDANFIEKSKSIGDKMAFSQKSASILGGYLIILDGITSDREKFVIVIKAESHEALRASKNSGEIELLKDIFLSPSGKFFKIGVLYERNDDSLTYPNNQFGALVFDDQFLASNSKPAEYFYSSFLGFTLDQNDKLSTKFFYESLLSLIQNNVSEYQKQKELIAFIKSFYKLDKTGIINPLEFADKFLDGDLRRKYTTEIMSRFNRPFKKNLAMIDFTLKQHRIYFSDKVKLSSPEEFFESNIEIIETKEELEKAFEQKQYTILKIKGRPKHYSPN
jgi:hypothetical protein